MDVLFTYLYSNNICWNGCKGFQTPSLTLISRGMYEEERGAIQQYQIHPHPTVDMRENCRRNHFFVVVVIYARVCCRGKSQYWVVQIASIAWNAWTRVRAPVVA